LLFKCIGTLEDAQKEAEEGRYRSDFSADESFINNKPSRNLQSPTSSTSSMPLFEGNKLILYNAHNLIVQVFVPRKLYLSLKYMIFLNLNLKSLMIFIINKNVN